jgi:hypothetical protein
LKKHRFVDEFADFLRSHFHKAPPASTISYASEASSETILAGGVHTESEVASNKYKYELQAACENFDCFHTRLLRAKSPSPIFDCHAVNIFANYIDKKTRQSIQATAPITFTSSMFSTMKDIAFQARIGNEEATTAELFNSTYIVSVACMLCNATLCCHLYCVSVATSAVCEDNTSDHSFCEVVQTVHFMGRIEVIKIYFDIILFDLFLQLILHFFLFLLLFRIMQLLHRLRKEISDHLFHHQIQFQNQDQVCAIFFSCRLRSRYRSEVMQLSHTSAFLLLFLS